MKSALQIARAAYKPRMPLILNQNVKTVDGQATESVSDRKLCSLTLTVCLSLLSR